MRRTALILASLAAGLCGCSSTPPPSTAPNARVAVPAAVPRTRSRRSHSRRGNTSAAPGDFDFYLLNLSWSPEYCVTHASSPECTSHLGFVVHGLWPQNDDGTFPEDCSNAPGPTNPQGDTDLQPTVSLVEHEWTTHGTCSGLGADAYFSLIRAAFQSVKIPADLQNPTTAQSRTPSAILSDFASANPSFPAASFALSCGNNQLTAIEVCIEKDLTPEACQSVKTCGANMVGIPPR